jgi:single-strand DNA-binding protein
MDLNKVFIIGRITQDIELKSTQGGQSVATVNIATNRSWKDDRGEVKKQTEFHRAVAWGKKAELISSYLSKGSLIYIEGHLQTRSWEAQDGGKRYSTEIIIDQVQFGPKPQGTAPAQDKSVSKSAEKRQRSLGQKEEIPVVEDDIPDYKPEDEIDVADIPF